MSVTQAQFEEIARWRQLHFGSANGKAVLEDLLRGLGLFVPWPQMKKNLEEHPGDAMLLVAAIEILAQLGVWHSDNFGHLIEAMAHLPMPGIKPDYDPSGAQYPHE